jgi:TPP-dependent pyruvate/acetoin dehydrogenase alpha subunit
VSRWRLAIIRSCGSRKRRQSKKHYARERKLRERWTAAVDAGNERLETQAYAALDDLTKVRETAQQRADELAERVEHASEPEPVDAMLDFYADLSAASALCAATRSALVPAPRPASLVLPAGLGRPYPRAQE